MIRCILCFEGPVRGHEPSAKRAPFLRSTLPLQFSPVADVHAPIYGIHVVSNSTLDLCDGSKFPARNLLCADYAQYHFQMICGVYAYTPAVFEAARSPRSDTLAAQPSAGESHDGRRLTVERCRAACRVRSRIGPVIFLGPSPFKAYSTHASPSARCSNPQPVSSTPYAARTCPAVRLSLPAENRRCPSQQ